MNMKISSWQSKRQVNVPDCSLVEALGPWMRWNDFPVYGSHRISSHWKSPPKTVRYNIYIAMCFTLFVTLNRVDSQLGRWRDIMELSPSHLAWSSTQSRRKWRNWKPKIRGKKGGKYKCTCPQKKMSIIVLGDINVQAGSFLWGWKGNWDNLIYIKYQTHAKFLQTNNGFLQQPKLVIFGKL